MNLPYITLFYKSKTLIFFLILFLLSTETNAIVISDGNVAYQSVNNSQVVTMSGFSVPQGDNSLLVVYTIVTNGNTSSSVTFGGTPMTQLGEVSSTFSLSIWYLPQGNLVTPVSGDIIANFSGFNIPSEAAIYAVSYKHVNQITPMDSFGQNVFGTAVNSSISISSDNPEDLIVDFITARNSPTSPTLTAGVGQNVSGLMTNQISSSANNSTHALSESDAVSCTVSMEWTISAHSSGNSYHIAAKINSDNQTDPRVRSDGNVTYQSVNSSSTVTMPGFSVPSGNNSLLVVYTIVTNGNTSGSVTFGGTPMIQLGEVSSTFSLSIWYLTQGNLAAPISGDIIANFSGFNIPSEAAIYVVSYKNVNQMLPMDNFGQNVFGTAVNSSISVSTNSPNDMVVDFITARNSPSTPTLTPGGEQNIIGLMTNQISSSANNSTHALSERCLNTGSSTLNMDWAISPHSSGNSYHIAAKICGIDIPPSTVPTLSEWGLIILALIIMIIGVLATSSLPRMALTNGQTTQSNTSLRNLPFDKISFLKIWGFVALTFAIGFGLAVAFWGYELTSADPLGSFVSSAIIGYLVMLLNLERHPKS